MSALMRLLLLSLIVIGIECQQPRFSVLTVGGRAIALLLAPFPDIPACLTALHSSKLCGYKNFTGCIARISHKLKAFDGAEEE